MWVWTVLATNFRRISGENPMQASTDIPGASALSDFCKQDDSGRVYSKELADIIEVIAAYGKYWHDWFDLKVLLAFRLQQILQKYYEAHTSAVGPPKPLVTGETFEELCNRLLGSLDAFDSGPPFTLQRLCEILLNPEAIYPNLDKVGLAFEKLLLVTSTISRCQEPYPSSLPPVKQLERKPVPVKVISDHEFEQRAKAATQNQDISNAEPNEEIPWGKKYGRTAVENGIPTAITFVKEAGEDMEVEVELDEPTSTEMEIEGASEKVSGDGQEALPEEALADPSPAAATNESETSMEEVPEAAEEVPAVEEDKMEEGSSSDAVQEGLGHASTACITIDPLVV